MSLSTLSVATPFTLANSLLHLVVRPDLGGRIDQLHDRRTGRDWLWHPDTYDATQSRSLSLGDAFDHNWTGGWDEIFPNDAAGPFQGWNLVDHGELWSQTWTVLESSDLAITLQYQCQTVPVLVTKTITLHPTEPEATIQYELRNQSDQAIPFLFKQHCAIAIQPGDEVLLPECWVEPAFIEFSQVIGRAGKTRFPKAYAADGTEVDLRVVPPPTSQLQEFYYSSDLASGQCGIYNSMSRSRLLMQFDQADFPYVWMFQSFGGWRDFYMVVVEPCTTLPYDLDIACQQGTVARLAPHAVQQRLLVVKVELAEYH
jgi:galactose mutarotase-like enzyme